MRDIATIMLWAILILPGMGVRPNPIFPSMACHSEEAQTVFLDERARLIDDPDHSDEEQRFVLLGYSSRARCLAVSHCYLEADSVIRLISARRAAPQEERVYWSFR